MNDIINFDFNVDSDLGEDSLLLVYSDKDKLLGCIITNNDYYYFQKDYVFDTYYKYNSIAELLIGEEIYKGYIKKLKTN